MSTRQIDRLIAENKYTVWLALGDSISEYNHCSEGYPNYLQHFDNHLRVKYGKGKYIIVNAAVGGYSLVNDLDFVLDKIDRFKPDFVTSMYGMNDSARGSKELGNFESRLDSLCKLLNRRRIQSVILTQNPIDFGCKIPCIQCRQDYPIYEKTVIETAGKNGIESIDIYSIWEKEVLAVNPNEHFKLLHDGIHPNHKGHEYIYGIMRKKLCEA